MTGAPERMDDVALVNLTPHPVTVYADDGHVVLRCPPAELPVRLPVRRDDEGEVAGVPVVVEHRGRVELPAPAPGVSFIVSYAVAVAHPERGDLLVPTDLVRSEEGTVVGCRAFSRIAADGGTIS
ncbi:hypothetical protein RIF23_10345 [Lipingzhangella sp. LS1_29]|uniref:Uncharacterized protein n=1 Tax=Lipingzhangella rawalii TaxID=2055835 RepID=A0ABU2H5X6_9ACTN|nr:hypothetical protein [Lipingzhangella rawalii]MDS1270698.1 hypothetical protein [Lipingzhangella rawalii]